MKEKKLIDLRGKVEESLKFYTTTNPKLEANINSNLDEMRYEIEKLDDTRKIGWQCHYSFLVRQFNSKKIGIIIGIIVITLIILI
jgi:hypothetical protein